MSEGAPDIRIHFSKAPGGRLAACGEMGVSVWTRSWHLVTCDVCLKFYGPPIDTFVIGERNGVHGITCLRCKKTSYNRHDIERHYCGYCKVWHGDIRPPVRQWWIDGGNWPLIIPEPK